MTLKNGQINRIINAEKLLRRRCDASSNEYFRSFAIGIALLSTRSAAERVSITKPFVCPDISPLPQHVTSEGNLVIDGQTYYLWKPNAAAASAPLTNTICSSSDGKTAVDIMQYRDGRFQQAFISFSTNIRKLPFGEDPEKYIIGERDSYMEGGQGCHN